MSIPVLEVFELLYKSSYWLIYFRYQDYITRCYLRSITQYTSYRQQQNMNQSTRLSIQVDTELIFHLLNDIGPQDCLKPSLPPDSSDQRFDLRTNGLGQGCNASQLGNSIYSSPHLIGHVTVSQKGLRWRRHS
jgi:hypothetical protein